MVSSSKTRNSEEIVLEARKLLEYSKQHVADEEKSWQLVGLAEEIQNKGGARIVGEYQGLHRSTRVW